MIKRLLISIFIFSSTTSLAVNCFINSYPRIIKLNRVLDDSVIKATNCSNTTIKTFVDLISGGNGELKSSHLSQILNSEFNKKVLITPELIKVEFINSTIEKLIDIPENLALKKTTSLYSKASLNLEKNSRISASCNSCSSAGEKNIKLKFGAKSIWLSAELLIKRVGFIATEDLSPYGQKLSRSLFRETTQFDRGTGHLFQDIKNIKFYKPTRKVQKGKFLKVSDLMPMTVIQPGKKVKIILKGKHISLNTTAFSRQAGKIGQTIELYNKKTNKNISGLVVDFNTVMVKL